MSIPTLPKYVRVAGSALLFLALGSHTALSAGGAVNVYVHGELLRFSEAQPVLKEGRTLVPFRKLFESLGYTVQWIDAGDAGGRSAVGTKDGVTIELTIDKNVARVNGSDVRLDVPAQIIGGSTMVPLRFVSENSGYDVAFVSSGNVSTITVGAARPSDPTVPTASADEAEPYVAKGRVVAANGSPVEGAEVFADNQLLYNSNLHAVTDADGYYRIELPLLAATWNMGGSHLVDEFIVDLIPDVDRPFAGNTGAVRNFTVPEAETIFGELYLYMDLNSFANGYTEDHVELTLVPDGNGRTIAGFGFNFPGGFGMNDVPVGTYTATAVYAPPGEERIPLKIRKRNIGPYADSVEFKFSPLVPGIQQAELEVQAP
ncbi:hypothetical protein FE782_08500 [Paenibacillus antri]|uniref:Copper amine oxidase-like N-terminal domain-containing protein n=1 Tax=Paenibacillus antri TaxID=2582848 RepID=A0A5R9GA85_9BACL|nr:stalk domain-containing protein [Paenibacillus antri]TLS52661.1 hypothetical protein FE782_08500 [Paenibacillus antri]